MTIPPNVAANLQEIYQLQSENEILSREHVELRQKIEQYKRRCRELKDKNGPLVKLQSMGKENRALTEDLEVCKSVICRLNAELLSSQEKLGIVEEPEVTNRQVLDIRNRTFVINDVNNKFSDRWPELKGLMLAYDQVIQDKNETIKGHENTLHQFKAQCKEIINENQDLHTQISDKQEKVTMSKCLGQAVLIQLQLHYAFFMCVNREWFLLKSGKFCIPTQLLFLKKMTYCMTKSLCS